MKHKALVLPFTAAVLTAVGVYLFYSFSNEALNPEDRQVESPQTVLQAPTPERLRDSSVPFPPPANSAAQPQPEPQRKLVGVAAERLKQIEQSLPKGSEICRSAVGSDKSMAAVLDADLDSDGVVETIVVHTATPPTSREPTPPLVLSVLASDGGALSQRASVPLTGGVLFNIKMDGSEEPLVVGDLTGDHRPEIIVASGIGASLGGMLQVFKVNGSSLANISQIEGNLFQISRRVRQPIMISVHSRYDKTPVTYRWNGHQFIPTN